MTDAEIYEVMKCYSTNGCLDYPSFDDPVCMTILMASALGLINRQLAEIEKLKNEVFAKEDEYNDMVEQRNRVESHLETAKAEAIKEFADNLCRVFAGHSDYHGDTILAKIICSKEGKPIQTAKPIDTSKIKYAAIKEFAERLKKIYATHDGLWATIDDIIEEMVGENNV